MNIELMEIGETSVCGSGKIPNGITFGFVVQFFPRTKWYFSPARPANTEKMNEIKKEIIQEILKPLSV